MTRLDPAILTAAQSDWRAWCARLVGARRADPGNDIVTGLIRTPVDADGNCLADDEIVGAIQLLLFAGFGTTSDATSNIVIRLIQEPGLEALLRAHPEQIPAAIDEALRLEPPVTTRPRRALEDVEIDGHMIRKGERILCNYLAANVDPDEWEDPDEFRIDRTRNRAVTFGIGLHRCSGSTMARIELRIMVEELLKRVTGIQWDADQREARVSFLATVWRGVDSLPVVFTPCG
jgi:cytochrome P450